MKIKSEYEISFKKYMRVLNYPATELLLSLSSQAMHFDSSVAGFNVYASIQAYAVCQGYIYYARVSPKGETKYYREQYFEEYYSKYHPSMISMRDLFVNKGVFHSIDTLYTIGSFHLKKVK